MIPVVLAKALISSLFSLSSSLFFLSASSFLFLSSSSFFFLSFSSLFFLSSSSLFFLSSLLLLSYISLFLPISSSLLFPSSSSLLLLSSISFLFLSFSLSLFSSFSLFFSSSSSLLFSFSLPLLFSFSLPLLSSSSPLPSPPSNPSHSQASPHSPSLTLFTFFNPPINTHFFNFAIPINSTSFTFFRAHIVPVNSPNSPKSIHHHNSSHSLFITSFNSPPNTYCPNEMVFNEGKSIQSSQLIKTLTLKHHTHHTHKTPIANLHTLQFLTIPHLKHTSTRLAKALLSNLHLLQRIQSHNPQILHKLKALITHNQLSQSHILLHAPLVKRLIVTHPILHLNPFHILVQQHEIIILLHYHSPNSVHRFSHRCKSNHCIRSHVHLRRVVHCYTPPFSHSVRKAQQASLNSLHCEFSPPNPSQRGAIHHSPHYKLTSINSLHTPSLLHILHQTLVHKVHKRSGPLRGRQSRRLSIAHESHHLQSSTTSIRILSLRQLDQCNAQRPHITLQLRSLIIHFTSHVPRGTTLCAPLGTGMFQLHCQSEITQLDHSTL